MAISFLTAGLLVIIILFFNFTTFFQMDIHGWIGAIGIGLIVGGFGALGSSIVIFTE